ncbi:MAG: radical SAM protein [Acidobacteria bacterium]|nr:radical SAM protein [Acidobacteriota bacterium]
MDFRSYVISWNITRRCNLACEHCYLDAEFQGAPKKEPALPGELSTEECYRVVDQIAEANPNALLILTGGEPLLRRDVFQIASYANQKKLWVVVGTNGVIITRNVAERMKESGVRGVSLSLDSLDPETHDRFRGVRGAWENTVRGAQVLNEAGLPFIVQTTISKINHHEIPAIADKAYEMGARVFNLYFLVPTGRGRYISNVTPEEYESLMHRLTEMQRQFQGKMLINSKCAPHYQRVLYEQDPQSPFLKTFALGAGGCPAGTHYCGISPSGDLTPCPYLPVYAGNLREHSFSELWNESELFTRIRNRKELGGRCGPCEFNAVCGGCRARAYGSTGDYMAEDPWCVYQPGKYNFVQISFDQGPTYGVEARAEMRWTEEARRRLEMIPAFVRGMVIKGVEGYARDRGHSEITPEILAEVREKIGPRFFRK